MVREGTAGINDFLKQEWLHPVQHPILNSRGVSAEILRLDRIHPQVSGNKWLKLDYWLQKFRAGSFNGILTTGGPWSNHLHACAFACYKNNIRMEAMVKGHEGLSNPMLDDLKRWQVTVRFVNRNKFYNPETHQTDATANNLLYIPMGGNGPEGQAGVTQWMNALPLGHFNDVFCPVGTGTTLAGIASSNLSTSQLTGADPGTGDAKIPVWIEKLQQQHRDKKIRLLQSGHKIGKLTHDIQLFMNDWYQQTGIEADFVYTAPMFRIFLEKVSEGEITSGSRILLIHTGGLQGNRSIKGLEF